VLAGVKPPGHDLSLLHRGLPAMQRFHAILVNARLPAKRHRHTDRYTRSAQHANTETDMGLKQLRRGMRYRFKTIKHRLRLQVRQISRESKARKFAMPPCDAPLSPWPELDRAQPDTEACSVPDRPGASLPTLRRPVRRDPVQ